MNDSIWWVAMLRDAHAPFPEWFIQSYPLTLTVHCFLLVIRDFASQPMRASACTWRAASSCLGRLQAQHVSICASLLLAHLLAALSMESKQRNSTLRCTIVPTNKVLGMGQISLEGIGVELNPWRPLFRIALSLETKAFRINGCVPSSSNLNTF